ncbi:MAG TPA: hypothetical protein VF850_10935 [Gemmatimonadaceae bacterium]
MAARGESGGGPVGARFLVHAVLAGLTLILAIWLSTGTMAPYGATAWQPFVLEPCHYLINIDHYHFEAVYLMLQHADRSSWEPSVMLRRILFPVLSLPFVRAFGFLAGGVIASILLHVVALIAFSVFVRRTVGEAGAITVMWLLATYPGITYWAGLPYSYVVIVPGALACTMLLYASERSDRVRDIARWCLWLGMINLGYDLVPVFGPAVLLRLVIRRRWRAILPAVVTMIAPTALLLLTFKAIHVDVLNSNTNNYAGPLSGYLHPLANPQLWGRYVLQMPAIFITNFLFGNMLFLPLLFVAALLFARSERARIVGPVDAAVLIAFLALFVFNNGAPPYRGWQMRGHWIARLYQPVFAAFLMPVARLTELATSRQMRAWRTAVVIAAVANASITFGPILMNPLAAILYQRFYVHSPADSLLLNLRHYGRRPLGFCDPSHDLDHFKPEPLPPDWHVERIR